MSGGGAKMAEPKIGDPVLFEGLRCRITNLTDALVRFASEMTVDLDGKVAPRFKTAGARPDLRWSDELGTWYLWGRLLSKGRGGVGRNEGKLVAELRDRGVLPARKTRRHGSPPAGGEELNLYLALFSRGIDWTREIERIKRGEKLSEVATAAVADYKERFKKKLVNGFASPDADDSTGEES